VGKKLSERVLKDWFARAHPRLGALLRNAGIVFGGNVLSSFVGLTYLAVLTRALSLEQFGLYSLYGALVAVVGRFTTFQTWQAQMHYAAHAKESENKPLIFNILFFGWLLDIVAGILGFGVAVLLASTLPQVFGLPQGGVSEVAVAAFILIFNWMCSPTAFFRIYDRFFPQALYQNISNILQLISVSILWAIGEDRLIVYLAVTSINNVFGQLWFFIYAVIEARKLGIVSIGFINYGLLKESCPGVRRFVLISNLDGIIRVLREVDIFIINAFLDLQAVALYKIVKTLNMAFGKLTGPFYQSIYPELARLAVSGNVASMVKLMKQVSLTLGSITMVVWLGFVFVGPYLLSFAFGPEYSAAYAVAVWCMASMVVWGIAQPLSPVMMAIRKPGLSMIVHLATTIFYVITLVFFVSQLGLIGAGVALLLFYVIWSTAMLAVAAKQLGRSFVGT